MNHRLSAKQYFIDKILIAFAVWLILSLPSPIALFEFILIRSDSVFFALLQRAIHFGVCLFIVIYFYKKRIVLEFNDQELIVVDKQKKREFRVPFKSISKMSFQPRYIHAKVRKFTFKLTFINNQGAHDELIFQAYPGRNLDLFRKLVVERNPSFVEE
jgi:hypothetical protein